MCTLSTLDWKELLLLSFTSLVDTHTLAVSDANRIAMRERLTYDPKHTSFCSKWLWSFVSFAYLYPTSPERVTVTVITQSTILWFDSNGSTYVVPSSNLSILILVISICSSTLIKAGWWVNDSVVLSRFESIISICLAVKPLCSSSVWNPLSVTRKPVFNNVTFNLILKI